jgi:hypothetical protein
MGMLLQLVGKGSDHQIATEAQRGAGPTLNIALIWHNAVALDELEINIGGQSQASALGAPPRVFAVYKKGGTIGSQSCPTKLSCDRLRRWLTDSRIHWRRLPGHIRQAGGDPAAPGR